MKKQLLAGTALVAATMLVAGGAMAARQENDEAVDQRERLLYRAFRAAFSTSQTST